MSPSVADFKASNVIRRVSCTAVDVTIRVYLSALCNKISEMIIEPSDVMSGMIGGNRSNEGQPLHEALVDEVIACMRGK